PEDTRITCLPAATRPATSSASEASQVALSSRSMRSTSRLEQNLPTMRGAPSQCGRQRRCVAGAVIGGGSAGRGPVGGGNFGRHGQRRLSIRQSPAAAVQRPPCATSEETACEGQSLTLGEAPWERWLSG